MECPRLPGHLLANARLLPDRYEILPLLPKGRVVAEIGVALGDLSENFLLTCQPREFIAVDLFKLHEIPMLWGKPTAELFGNRTHGEFYRERFAEPIRQGRMRVIEEDSVKAIEGLPDHSVDIFYVDADHSYASVAGELAVIKRKVRDDGLIILNDYIMNEAGFSNAPYGVIQATNEFMLSENWEMIYFALQSYMYCDVVLRKASSRGAAPAGERLAALEQQNAALHQALEAMRASRSWRLTAPLRSLRQSLRPKRERT